MSSPRTDDPITLSEIAYFEVHLKVSLCLSRFLSERDALYYASRFLCNHGLPTQHFILGLAGEWQTPTAHVRENNFSAAQFDICGAEQAAKIVYVMYIPCNTASLAILARLSPLYSFYVWINLRHEYVYSVWSLDETYMAPPDMIITLSNCIPTHVLFRPWQHITLREEEEIWAP